MGQAARGRPHAVGLQHPEGVDAPPGAAPAWWRKLSAAVRDPVTLQLHWRLATAYWNWSGRRVRYVRSFSYVPFVEQEARWFVVALTHESMNERAKSRLE